MSSIRWFLVIFSNIEVALHLPWLNMLEQVDCVESLPLTHSWPFCVQEFVLCFIWVSVMVCHGFSGNILLLLI